MKADKAAAKRAKKEARASRRQASMRRHHDDPDSGTGTPSHAFPLPEPQYPQHLHLHHHPQQQLPQYSPSAARPPTGGGYRPSTVSPITPWTNSPDYPMMVESLPPSRTDSMPPSLPGTSPPPLTPFGEREGDLIPGLPLISPQDAPPPPPLYPPTATRYMATVRGFLLVLLFSSPFLYPRLKFCLVLFPLTPGADARARDPFTLSLSLREHVGESRSKSRVLRNLTRIPFRPCSRSVFWYSGILVLPCCCCEFTRELRGRERNHLVDEVVTMVTARSVTLVFRVLH